MPRRLAMLAVVCLVLGLLPWHGDPLARLSPGVRALLVEEEARAPSSAAGPVREVTWDELIARRVDGLDGQRVSVTAYALPVAFEGARARRVLLVADPFGCCYGQVPEPTAWILGTSAAGVDLPGKHVRATGVLRVEERRDASGGLVGVYRLRITRLSGP